MVHSSAGLLAFSQIAKRAFFCFCFVDRWSKQLHVCSDLRIELHGPKALDQCVFLETARARALFLHYNGIDGLV